MSAALASLSMGRAVCENLPKRDTLREDLGDLKDVFPMLSSSMQKDILSAIEAEKARMAQVVYEDKVRRGLIEVQRPCEICDSMAYRKTVIVKDEILSVCPACESTLIVETVDSYVKQWFSLDPDWVFVMVAVGMAIGVVVILYMIAANIFG